MYAQLSVRNYTPGSITEAFINMLDGKASQPGIGLYNVFEEPAYRYFAGLKDLKQKFLAAGANDVHVAGSGPTLFSLTRDDEKAYDVHKQLLGMGLQAHLADF
jgi:4-diphosphocytidyl-2-C-methyl-D-erythritol kinase